MPQRYAQKCSILVYKCIRACAYLGLVYIFTAQKTDLFASETLANRPMLFTTLSSLNKSRSTTT